MITRRSLSAFIWWWTACWVVLVVLLLVYWWDLPRYVSWPLAVLEAIFAPDIKVLKQELLGRGSEE